MKIAFITGGATGIGRALARKLDDEGWRVYVGHREGQDVASLRAESSERLHTVVCDVTDMQQLERVATEVRVENTRLDLLHNNAAVAFAAGPVEDMDIDRFRELMEVNFWGTVRTIKAFSPLLRTARGRVINTSSASIYMYVPLGSPYPVSKIAVDMLSHHMRIEMAHTGVEVTSLQPGGVRTPMTQFPAEETEQFWRDVPAHLRAEYQAQFLSGGEAIEGRFSFWTPERFAEEVYTKIVCARKLKPSYVLGPGVASMPIMQRVLSTQAKQKVWDRLFRRKQSG